MSARPPFDIAGTGDDMRETLVDKILAYEAGTMTGNEAVAFFQDLVDSGLAWKLQGHYGRVAESLIRQGLIEVRRLYHPVGVQCDLCTDPRAMFGVTHVSAPCTNCGHESLPTGRLTLKCPNCRHEDTVAEEAS